LNLEPVAPLVRIGIDAMGGDSAPSTEVDGARQAALELQGAAELVLVGEEDRIHRYLDREEARRLGIKVEHTTQRVSMAESAALAYRRKQDSSIGVAARMLRDGRLDALVSAGNTGAVVASVMLSVGRIPGVHRPAIAVLIPTPGGHTILLDVGANSDAKPQHLLQYAVMGKVYAQSIFGVESPRIGLLNIGEEDSKGSELAVQAWKLMNDAKPNLNFIGNVEGRDVLRGTADVVVCDGFTGNVILKFAESVVGLILQTVRREVRGKLTYRLGALLLKPVFRRMKSRLNYEEYGGAPLLGVNGICVISHGSSSPLAIKNAIRVAAEAARRRIHLRIQEELDREPSERQILG
jgi:glycerol-3-phosphate acyltransferase PlsX